MRIIDADSLLTERMKRMYYHLPNGDTAIPIIDIEHAPTIKTKQIKYFDEDEKVWKVGEVIVSRSEKPNNCDTCKWGEWYRNGRDIINMDYECGGCCPWNSKWTPTERSE